MGLWGTFQIQVIADSERTFPHIKMVSVSAFAGHEMAEVYSAVRLGKPLM
jgi:hypothetical protein